MHTHTRPPHAYAYTIMWVSAETIESEAGRDLIIATTPMTLNTQIVFGEGYLDHNLCTRKAYKFNDTPEQGHARQLNRVRRRQRTPGQNQKIAKMP